MVVPKNLGAPISAHLVAGKKNFVAQQGLLVPPNCGLLSPFPCAKQSFLALWMRFFLVAFSKSSYSARSASVKARASPQGVVPMLLWTE